MSPAHLEFDPYSEPSRAEEAEEDFRERLVQEAEEDMREFFRWVRKGRHERRSSMREMVANKSR